MGMSLVVLMLTVATLVPALDPMYGTPLVSTCLKCSVITPDHHLMSTYSLITSMIFFSYRLFNS